MKDWYDWWYLIFDNAKTHLVPAELKDELIQNMKRRGCKISGNLDDGVGWACAETIEGGLCRGGARMATDLWLEFELPGLLFRLYAADVEFYLDRLRDAEPRLELRTVYYKLHGDLHCVCLLPEVKDELEQLLTARLEEANAIRDVEFQAFNEVMQSIDCSYIDPGAPREHRLIKDA